MVKEQEHTRGTEAIRRERMRQIAEEGYDPMHDHADDLMAAALAYISAAFDQLCNRNRSNMIALAAWWPWGPEHFKPTTTRRDLEKAGALVAAALDCIGAGESGDEL